MARGLRAAKTPASRSRALLLRVTRADQYLSSALRAGLSLRAAMPILSTGGNAERPGKVPQVAAWGVRHARAAGCRELQVLPGPPCQAADHPRGGGDRRQGAAQTLRPRLPAPRGGGADGREPAPRQASARRPRQGRMGHLPFRHDRRARRLWRAGRAARLCVPQLRLRQREVARLYRSAQARPYGLRRGCRPFHRRGEAGAGCPRQIADPEALPRADRGRARPCEIAADGPEPDRRHREPLCRRDPVPGPPPSGAAGLPPDARRGRAALPGHAPRAEDRGGPRRRLRGLPRPAAGELPPAPSRQGRALPALRRADPGAAHGRQDGLPLPALSEPALTGPQRAEPARASAARRRSSVKRPISWSLTSSSARSSAEGWTVASTTGASFDSTGRPRSTLTRKLGPSRVRAAVAPRQTSTLGRTSAISASTQGRQARISMAFGLEWMRFLPRGSHLKCFTALVT